MSMRPQGVQARTYLGAKSYTGWKITTSAYTNPPQTSIFVKILSILSIIATAACNSVQPSLEKEAQLVQRKIELLESILADHQVKQTNYQGKTVISQTLREHFLESSTTRSSQKTDNPTHRETSTGVLTESSQFEKVLPFFSSEISETPIKAEWFEMKQYQTSDWRR